MKKKIEDLSLKLEKEKSKKDSKKNIQITKSILKMKKKITSILNMMSK